MPSITINSSALAAARSVQALDKQVAEAQVRVAAKSKLVSARDNVSNWANTTNLKAEIKSYEKMSDLMDYSKAALDKAATGVNSIKTILSDMKSLMTDSAAGTWTPAQRAQADADLAAMQMKLRAVMFTSREKELDYMQAAGFIKHNVAFSNNGVISFRARPSVDFDAYLQSDFGHWLGSGKNFYTFTIDSATSAGVNNAKYVFDVVSYYVGDYGSQYENESRTIASAKATIQKLVDIKSAAIKQMVDADLDEEKARLAALQAKQQLARQTLSITNSSAKSILLLFQNSTTGFVFPGTT